MIPTSGRVLLRMKRAPETLTDKNHCTLSVLHGAQTGKNPPAVWETQVRSLGRDDPLKKYMASHSSILAWRIPWTEEPGGL